MGKDRERIIIVDDDPSVRRGLKRLFVSSDYEVEEFASAQQFLDAELVHDRPSCLVLDVQLPGLTGLDLQKELLERGRDMPIVFITGHGDIPMSVEAMKLGAVDFLPKPVGSEELIRAVCEALQKDRKLRTQSAEQGEIRRRLDTLTPREFEVLRYVISGFLNKQAAYALGITEKTVKVHRARVMEKMGASSLVELTRLADKGGVRPASADEM